MKFRTKIALLCGKVIQSIICFLHLGSGIAVSGKITLMIDPYFLKNVRKKFTKIILVTGTNGKTTTNALIYSILTQNDLNILSNKTGANLTNGIVGSILSSYENSYPFIGVFEVDEAAFSEVAYFLTPDIVIFLNLFRDQLDRYGELNTIAKRWIRSVKQLPKSTKIIANADDPLIYYIAESSGKKVYYFGLSDIFTKTQSDLAHASDSTYCRFCGEKLRYRKIYLSHLGDWWCKKCKKKRPNISSVPIHSPLKGIYNLYNVNAAITTAYLFHIPFSRVKKYLKSFSPSFGRGEKLIYRRRKIEILLSKNPAGCNESIRLILDQNDVDAVLIALNDKIPDGIDVSWIWDVDFEKLVMQADYPIILTGDRVYDLLVRIKYCASFHDYMNNNKIYVYENMKDAILQAVVASRKKIYVMATYSAMLSIRHIITGRKIPLFS